MQSPWRYHPAVQRPFHEQPEEIMHKWARRIRHAAVTAITWAAAGFVAGLLVARGPGFYSDLPLALLFAPLGFLSGIIFSVILLLIDDRHSFEHMSLASAAALGTISGLLLSAIIVAGAAYRGAPVWNEFMLFGPPLSAGSALCAAGSLVLARRAARRHALRPQ
jgi:hypothetical protein